MSPVNSIAFIGVLSIPVVARRWHHSKSSCRPDYKKEENCVPCPELPKQFADEMLARGWRFSQLSYRRDLGSAVAFFPDFAHVGVGAALAPLKGPSTMQVTSAVTQLARRARDPVAIGILFAFLAATPAHAASPWENAVTVLQNTFTST